MTSLYATALFTGLMVVLRAWPLAVAAAVVSLAFTVTYRLSAIYPFVPFNLMEIPLFAGLVFVTVWQSPVRVALLAGGSAALAAGCLILRTDAPFRGLETVYAVGFWSLLPASAGALAYYLRHQRETKARDQDLARRQQRLDLAGDLHDYVAHDVSEMIAQAQAAALTAGPDLRPVLERIEAAGQRAMTSMDRMVHMLHAEHRSGLDDLPELTERFAESTGARVSLDLDPALTGRVPRELTSTLHRVVVEALTNVRRHAPDTHRVAVAVTAVGDDVQVSVVNDVSRPAHDSGRGGLGLAGLTERVRALNGTLTAGPSGDGWQVVARMPVTP